MRLLSNKKPDTLVGVDIDASSIAAVQIDAEGRPLRSGVVALPDGAVVEGEVADRALLANGLRDLFDREGFSKQVRLGIANQRVAFRTVRLPVIEDAEQLRAAVGFQAQEQIPMPLDAAVVEHQVVGGAIAEDGGRQIDVAVVAAREESVSAFVEAARSAGLDPAGVDFAAFGMIRALAAPAIGSEQASDGEEFVPAALFCSLGDLTNLAIARDRACLFSRFSLYGVRDIAASLAADTGLPSEHAEQWLLHTGLLTPLDEVEGDAPTAASARAALEAGVNRLADELRLSLDYYGGQDGAAPVGDIVLCGWGSAIPGIAERLGEELGRTVSARRPGALSGIDDAQASRLTLPYGLALES